ncbi:phosphonate C-P lyase system protein PhnG [Burkholderia singularis]|uniref:PhnG protein n=1 Tax=Burkholderia singularis TaxID=1503053 RepID=A0A238H732_9BURK|nr:phosphonate C-P lyase system protein PhnG [Burkholderia singularis]SMG00873.1 PhnG protein [Burkholderia singularis]
MTTSSASPSFAARRDWLALLAGMPRDELERSLEQALAGAPAPGYDWLRPPETGLAMVRGRIGGTGDPFNLGEASVTRAVLRLAHDGAPMVLGIAYQLGRDKRRAELAALADALLQLPAYRARVEAQVIAPYRARLAQRRAARARDAAATRVEFFTMVRGD